MTVKKKYLWFLFCWIKLIFFFYYNTVKIGKPFRLSLNWSWVFPKISNLMWMYTVFKSVIISSSSILHLFRCIIFQSLLLYFTVQQYVLLFVSSKSFLLIYYLFLFLPQYSRTPCYNDEILETLNLPFFFVLNFVICITFALSILNSMPPFFLFISYYSWYLPDHQQLFYCLFLTTMSTCIKYNFQNG